MISWTQRGQVLPGQILHAAAEPVTEDEHTTVLLQNGGAVDIRLALRNRHPDSSGINSIAGTSRSVHAEVWYKSQNKSAEDVSEMHCGMRTDTQRQDAELSSSSRM